MHRQSTNVRERQVVEGRPSQNERSLQITCDEDRSAREKRQIKGHQHSLNAQVTAPNFVGKLSQISISKGGGRRQVQEGRIRLRCQEYVLVQHIIIWDDRQEKAQKEVHSRGIGILW